MKKEVLARVKVGENGDYLTHARPAGGGGEAFRQLFGNGSATFLKILGPGNLRSGHQVRSSDPTSKKLSNRESATVVEDLELSGFGILPSTYNLYISDFFYIGDLRSGQFRDLPIIPKSMGENSSKSNTYQICSKRPEPCSFRLLLMTPVQICTCEPLKGYLRSNYDVMRSKYVFAGLTFDWNELETWDRRQSVPLT